MCSTVHKLTTLQVDEAFLAVMWIVAELHPAREFQGMPVVGALATTASQLRGLCGSLFDVNDGHVPLHSDVLAVLGLLLLVHPLGIAEVSVRDPDALQNLERKQSMEKKIGAVLGNKKLLGSTCCASHSCCISWVRRRRWSRHLWERNMSQK